VEPALPVVSGFHALVNGMLRRDLVKLAGAWPLLIALAWAAPRRDARLLIVFLRGGYDAANVVAPTGSDFYVQARPTLHLARPSATDPKSALPLDGDWSLHPALRESLYPFWKKRQLAFVPFVGSDDHSRSHFQVQDYMELGQRVADSDLAASGFLSRLQAQLGQARSISFTEKPALAFLGGGPVPNIPLANVQKPEVDDRQAGLIAQMYAGDALEPAVAVGLRVRGGVYRSISGEAADGHAPARSFELTGRRMGRLMREDYSLAFVDVGGWDTHVDEGAATGSLAARLADLGRGLAAFADELGAEVWKDTVVVVLSEFGRTFRENGNGGTDHGHGSIYWVMGGAVRGGRVAGPQLALKEPALFENRDLPVLTDYRSLLGGLFQGLYGLSHERVSAIFPRWAPAHLGLL
jgi:uncharacterized protein (DUF1501 family)